MYYMTKKRQQPYLELKRFDQCEKERKRKKCVCMCEWKDMVCSTQRCIALFLDYFAFVLRSVLVGKRWEYNRVVERWECWPIYIRKFLFFLPRLFGMIESQSSLSSVVLFLPLKFDIFIFFSTNERRYLEKISIWSIWFLINLIILICIIRIYDEAFNANITRDVVYDRCETLRIRTM